jgi:hypothetical protein
VLRYAPPAGAGLAATLVMLILFNNVSLRVFGGLFDYLQLDLFALLGGSMRMKYEHPEQFAAMDGRRQAEGAEAQRPLAGLQNLRPSDRLFELRDVGLQFRNALHYFSLDLLLTAATILNIPLLPGLDMGQTATLSTILKIPVMVVLAVGILYGLQVALASRGKLDYPSYTYRQEIARGEQHARATEQLLRSVQGQRTGAIAYVDVHANRFLLSLAGKR